MRKLWLLLGAALVLAVFQLIPFETTDVAKLQPVQTIVVVQREDGVQVQCGEKLTGQGEDLQAALQDLKRSAEGTVFFGTAQQIVVCGDWPLWVELSEIEELRPAARLYQAQQAPDAQQVTAFLLQHQSEITLLDLRAALVYEQDLSVPCLQQEDGRYWLDGRKPV